MVQFLCNFVKDSAEFFPILKSSDHSDAQSNPPMSQFVTLPLPTVARQALRIIRDPLNFLTAATRRYGPLLHADLGGVPVYVLNTPETIRHVLINNQRNYTKATPQFETFKLVTGNGLLNSDGDFWRQQRRIAQPAFHQRRLQTLDSLIVSEAQILLKRWQMQAGARLDIEHEMLTLTLPIVCQALFGVDVRARAHELVELTAAGLDYAMFRARVLLPIPLSWPLPINRRFRHSQARLDAFIYDLIAARRADPAEHNDLLALLLDAVHSDGQPLSDMMIRDEVMTMLVAGYETVATGLTWTWHLLATEPEAAAQLRAELKAVLDGRAPTLSDLPQLPYLRMVVEEAWRLYPPAWLITRRATATDEIAGARIPAGAVMVISPYVLHHSAEYWPAPDRFDPTRFQSGAPAPTHCTFLPFGAGPRLCIGNRLAEVEAQLILATLAPHFAPVHVSTRPVALNPLVTIRPRGGLPMQLHPVA